MQNYDPQKHHRKSIRRKGIDYSSQGLYFITICVQNRACLFGQVEHGQLVLTAAGQMVESEWLKLPARFTNVVLHEFVVMPNHFHGILEIVAPVGATLVVAQKPAQEQPQGQPQLQQLGQPQLHPQLQSLGQPQLHPQLQSLGQPQLQSLGQPQLHPQLQSLGQPQLHPQLQSLGQPQGLPLPTVGDIVGAFQSIVTVEYIRAVKKHGWIPFDRKLWQRNYWEHIIRNERAFQNISNYIKMNPAKWVEDMFFSPP